MAKENGARTLALDGYGSILKGAMPVRVRPPAPGPIVKSEASSAAKPVGGVKLPVRK